MFESVQNIIDAVEAPVTDDASRAVLNNSINRGLEDVDRSIGRVLDIRTRVGSRLAAIENQSDTNDSFALTLQQTIGELEDLDYAEALSRLSFELTILEASQQSFVRTQSLSLFNFL
jgi:flagellar hook-associated protein 3 FlgL